jgi:hypothetical protein
MSNDQGPPKHNRIMKLKDYVPYLSKNEGELIAGFGQARLIKTLECKYELRGGSHEDRLAAREWISWFMHEAVVKEV